jgi:hypothetical protein
VVTELDGDADPLQCEHGLAPEVARHGVRRVVEVAAGVDRRGRRTVRIDVLQQEELDLGVGVERKALLRRA